MTLQQRRDGLNGKNGPLSPITGKQFVLVGAGGAGRALAFGAKIRGAKVVVFDIDFGRILILINKPFHIFTI